MSGIVYCLTNPAMPDYLKIGMTTGNLRERLRQLYTTGVPVAFVCEFAIHVDDPAGVEKLLHETFADRRVHSKREFFTVSAPHVLAAMHLANGSDVTPRSDEVEDEEAQNALNAARTRRENFNFEMVGIQPGAELEFLANSDDSTATKAVVCSKNRIKFEDEELSLSKAAGRLLERRGLYSGVAGPEYWYFEGESLGDRRRRMEAEG